MFPPTRPDVWTHPELFKLKPDLSPKLVAGVPPDYYSATGQLWGNPVYNWAAHKKTGYAWWIWRMKSNMALFDVIRLDHFRGFAAYWEVDAAEEHRRGRQVAQGPRHGAVPAPSRRRSAPFRSSRRIWACRPTRCASC